jgi:protein-L-isoaspartate O-methyltransferase
MGTDAVTTVAPAADADALRKAMVDKLRSWGGVRTAAVEAAMRAVPRHLFVPEASLERAYGPERGTCRRRGVSSWPLAAAWWSRCGYAA